ncbi:ROK family protein [Nonomuraea sp. NEAU-A123]|uniref:ROK family protein n=1 Tax=Nonomuraea sp. NEAU-A123 TaxID=2839649 RepID=UPI001BE46B00|nr:ROK family protein [Nonomuraea sp. NEAU-A123]MBT2233804.1 ROK family protein [Nonomuraea sp. NEAU-A123]
MAITGVSTLRMGVSSGEILSLFRDIPDGLTKADVMRHTGLSRTTVNQRLDGLLAAGLLMPAPTEARTGGRPAGQFVVNRGRGVLLVADVGATGLRTAVCDLGGEVRAERDVRADVTSGPTAILTIVSKLFAELLDERGHAPGDVLGIGIDVPGPVDFASGRVVSPPIMTGWDRFDIPGWFTAHYNCPVLVDKDVNAMAFGEQRLRYPEVPHLLMVKIGTGIGTGLIAGGQVHRGADGAAGDIGHIQVVVDDVAEPPLCRCGNVGCVEAYTGGWALVRDLQAAGRDIASVDDAVRLIRSGDLVAVRLARRAARILGGAIADTVNLFNPRIIAIGGQLAHTDEQLFAGIREIVYRRSLPLATRNLQIVRSDLDPNAGILGLAQLLVDGIYSPQRVQELVDRGGAGSKIMLPVPDGE